MPRKKIEFTEEMNFRITQLVEAGKTLMYMVDNIKNQFGLKITIPTIQKQIEVLGLKRKDSRRMNGKKIGRAHV